MDEQHKVEELELEIEAQTRQAVNFEPASDDDDVEAHVRQSKVRMDMPRQA